MNYSKKETKNILQENHNLRKEVRNLKFGNKSKINLNISNSAKENTNERSKSPSIKNQYREEDSELVGILENFDKDFNTKFELYNNKKNSNPSENKDNHDKLTNKNQPSTSSNVKRFTETDSDDLGTNLKLENDNSNITKKQNKFNPVIKTVKPVDTNLLKSIEQDQKR